MSASTVIDKNKESHGVAETRPVQVVLCGNPNCGKTTLFNALTGLRAKVGNYPGVTVERKEGRLIGPDKDVTILDVPGTYSLAPQSMDEEIARDVLFGRIADVPPPDVVAVIVDASNLQRNLYFATQVIELGYPTIVALNMVDVAIHNGQEIDAPMLARELGVPVVTTVANTGTGLDEMREAILSEVERVRTGVKRRENRIFCELPVTFRDEIDDVARSLPARNGKTPSGLLRAEAALLLTNVKPSADLHSPTSLQKARNRLEQHGIDWRCGIVEARYKTIADIQLKVTRERGSGAETTSDRLDRIFTHRYFGLFIFAGLMLLMFQSIFSFAQIPMDWIQAGVDKLGSVVGTLLPAGALNDLLVKGIIQGVGAVIVFLPQICLLFLFIGLLEDTGYMARAAFLMDRLMSKVGLHGKSFIPMLSSFACAIPGILATRTIESPKDRLATILVAPLMSCSARLPVYTVLIAACIPNLPVLGFMKLPALTMFGMYALGIVVALGMAWLFKKTLLRGPTPMLILELPPYRRPLLRSVLRHMWERSQVFLRRAGTIILGINILLWFLASYPKTEASAATAVEQEGAALRSSFAGKMGRAIEPIIQPLGYDWKIGIGIVSSFAAREVFVSTMSLVYNVGETENRALADNLRSQRRPDGTRVFTLAVALSLMVFYVFALQCVSTVVVVRRETNSWKWPVFQWVYMGVLAWVFAFVTYRVGIWLGWN